MTHLRHMMSIAVAWSQTPPVTQHPILLRITRLPVGRRASGFVQVAKCFETRRVAVENHYRVTARNRPGFTVASSDFAGFNRFGCFPVDGRWVEARMGAA